MTVALENLGTLFSVALENLGTLFLGWIVTDTIHGLFSGIGSIFSDLFWIFVIFIVFGVLFAAK